MSRGEVTVLLPTHNRAHLLPQVLPSYANQDLVSTVVVMDDASSDDTAAVVARLASASTVPIHYLCTGTRLGAAGARNRAVRELRAPYVLWGEDDVVLEPSYVRRLHSCLQETGAAVAGGILLYLRPDETSAGATRRYAEALVPGRPCWDARFIELDRRGGPPIGAEPREVPFLHAVVLLSADWQRKAPFDEDYRGNGYREETDFQLSIKALGARVVACPKALCLHLPRDPARPGGQHERSLLNYEFWTIRNNNRFIDKHYDMLRGSLGVTLSRRALKWKFAWRRLRFYLVPQLKSALATRILGRTRK